MKMICKHCNYITSDRRLKYCQECGTELIEGDYPEKIIDEDEIFEIPPPEEGKDADK